MADTNRRKKHDREPVRLKDQSRVAPDPEPRFSGQPTERARSERDYRKAVTKLDQAANSYPDGVAEEDGRYAARKSYDPMLGGDLDRIAEEDARHSAVRRRRSEGEDVSVRHYSKGGKVRGKKC